MKKKILVVGPVLSMSGYGEQSRFALRALKSREDLFEIFIHPLPWGKTGWIWDDNEFRSWIDKRITITSVMSEQKKLQLDMTLQIGIPNEWKKIAPINIGYTAGIETTKVAPAWLQKGNEMDKILVVSNHAKTVFEQTVATATNNKTGEQFPYKLQTPIDVVWELTERKTPEEIKGIDLENDFNFLLLSQWSPRKNFENTIRWWIEEFIDQNVGLIVKTNTLCNSIIDRTHTEKLIEDLMKPYSDRRCSVYLLHGDLSEGQMRWLYEHDKIKALINISHGEGFGLPMFEAAREALPIVTIGWSGHLDFLHHDGIDYFQPVDYTLQPVQKQAVWPGVIEEDSMWAFADQGSYKMTLRRTYKKWTTAKKTAMELQDLNEEKFNKIRIFDRFTKSILGDSCYINEIMDDEVVFYE